MLSRRLNMEFVKMKIRLRRKKTSTTVLFDAEFYASQTETVPNPEIAWKHYCKLGFREGYDPHPLFSTRYYQNAYLGGNFELNPVLHYLSGEDKLCNPHPLFDARTYLEQIGNPVIATTILEHFLAYNAENQASPSVFFDTRKYLFANPEVAPCGFNALYHYLRYGKLQARDLYIDQNLIHSVIKRAERLDYDCLLTSHQPQVRFLARVLGMDLTRPTVILAANNSGHEYAPIIKKISTELTEVYQVNTVQAFGFNPPDAENFVPFGPTVCLNWEDTKTVGQTHLLECVGSTLKALNAAGAIYLDSHPSKTLTWLAGLHIPVHAVIPKLQSSEFANSVSHLCRLCQSVVVSASHVRQVKELPTAEDVVKVSFTETDFDAINRPLEPNTAVTQMKSQLKLSTDTVLVVGTGEIGYDCGFDRFVSVAASAAAELQDRPVQFLWVGGVGSNSQQAVGLLEELEQADLGDRVLICEDAKLFKTAVHSADILLLTHRSSVGEPPINEYLAAERPIVWFKGNSLTDRIMVGDPCQIAPGNVIRAVSLLKQINEDPDFTRQIEKANRKRRAKATSIADLVYALSQPLVLKTLERRALGQLPADSDRHIIKMPAIQAGSRHRRRVIFTAPNWQISGVNTFIETLVNELNKLDYEAYVLFTTTQPLTEQKPLLPHMPYQLLSQESHLRPKRRKELLHQYLAAMSPCVFVPNYDYVASTVTPELQDNIATLGVLHSDDPQHYVHGYRMGPYWDAIVSVSQTIQDKLLALNPSFEKKSTVIRYGIRDEGKTIAPRQQGTAEKLRIVYTGRIIQHQKLIFDFVDVARKLNDYRNQFEMVFVGDGPDFPELQKRMAPFVKSGLVKLAGRVKPETISEILLSSHVFALTSEFEGLPLSMLEALGAGLVPVVTDVESGIGEVCIHDHNALISPIGQPAALADNLLKLANAAELFNRLSNASRQTFLDQKLTAVDMAEQYAVVLDNLFDGIREAAPVRTDKLIYCPNIERLLNVA